MTPEEILAKLVQFPSVVGTPNQGIVDWVKGYLQDHGAQVHVLPGPEGDRSNLFATFGDGSRPGYILSAHLDVVPAGEPEWKGDPFLLRQDGERLIGRGACDMKGFVAAVLSMVPEFAALTLAAPIHIALSYDEEAGCKGVPHMLAHLPVLCAPACGALIGEPTGLVPVLAHKGKAAMRLVSRGEPGHSSRPDLGKNAIHMMVPVLASAIALAKDLAAGAQDDRFQPSYSTLQIGTISGGQAVNIIPDRADTCIELRAIPGQVPEHLLTPLAAIAKAHGLSVETLSNYPALGLDRGHPLAALVCEISGHAAQDAVSFGTEAGLFQAGGVPAIICGPGDMARAHRPEEFITQAELQAARLMLRRLAARLQA